MPSTFVTIVIHYQMSEKYTHKTHTQHVYTFLTMIMMMMIIIRTRFTFNSKKNLLIGIESTIKVNEQIGCNGSLFFNTTLFIKKKFF